MIVLPTELSGWRSGAACLEACPEDVHVVCVGVHCFAQLLVNEFSASPHTATAHGAGKAVSAAAAAAVPAPPCAAAAAAA